MSSAGAKTACSFRISTRSILSISASESMAFAALPLLALGGMAAVEAEADDDEGVGVADGWGRLCFKLEEDGGGSFPDWRRREVNEPRLYGFPFMGKAAGALLLWPFRARIPRPAFNAHHGGGGK